MCRKDFITGVFYLSQGGKLLCTPHAMEDLGEYNCRIITFHCATRVAFADTVDLTPGFVCKACEQPLTDYFITALEAKWHEDCFSCKGCRVPFLEPKFYNAGGFPYCAECHAEVTIDSLCSSCRCCCALAVLTECGSGWWPRVFSLQKGRAERT